MKTSCPIISRLHFTSLLVLLFMLPFLSGCASSWPWKSIEMPVVSLADIELQGIKGLETVFLLKLRVMNPNEEPLEIRGVNCTLEVDGKSFATGISDEQVTVPASAAQRFRSRSIPLCLISLVQLLSCLIIVILR
ncbi:MAG: hypothetical protein D3923_15530 [Candidatus Electrothrix sp. AR3]|nr:hypothetical protein [Candidatus Electrothrix sp. AR3]